MTADFGQCLFLRELEVVELLDEVCVYDDFLRLHFGEPPIHVDRQRRTIQEMTWLQALTQRVAEVISSFTHAHWN